MGYLVISDYKTYIQGSHLVQLVQGDDTKRVAEELSSVQQIVQRLTQRYDLDTEFTETLPYNYDTVYGAGARVTVDISQSGFSLWASGASYAEGDLVIQNEIGYICTTDNADLTFTTANWAAVAPRYTIYHGAYPTACTLNGQSNPPTLTNPYAPVFDYKNAYSKNDVVLWKGFTYVCAQDSTQITHQQALQYAQYSKLPFGNVFPDDPIANANGQYWNTKTAYVIPRGTPLSDPLWVKGDNRNQTIVDAMVTITVFKLSPTLAPMNRPAGWLEDYRCTLNDLNEIALGRMSITLPMKQPAQGLKTAFGSEVKNRNNY